MRVHEPLVERRLDDRKRGLWHFLIGERLVLQIDGGHHVGHQRDRDNAHDARLRLMGYHVIRVGYTQMMDDWAAVQESIMQAVARGLHRRRHGRRARDDGRTEIGEVVLLPCMTLPW